MDKQNHYHPLDIEQICCPEHVYELICIFEHRNREQEAIDCLISYFQRWDTRFILDNSKRATKLRKHLCHSAIQYSVAMVGSRDYNTAKVLLEAVENILSNVKYDKESQSLLASVWCNLAFIYVQEEETDLAVDVLDRAYKIDRKNKDLVGWVTIQLNRWTLLNSIGNYKEGYANVSEAVTLLENKVNEMMVNKVDTELEKNARFMDRMHLLCACYLVMIESLVQIGKDVKKIEETRNHALRLAHRFLGESHYLTVKLGVLQNPKPVKIRSNKNATQSYSSFGTGTKFSDTDRSLVEFSDASENYDLPEPSPPKKKGPPVKAPKPSSNKNLLKKARHEEPRVIESFDVHVDTKGESTSFLPKIPAEEERKFDAETPAPVTTQQNQPPKRPVKNINLQEVEDPPAAQPSPGPVVSSLIEANMDATPPRGKPIRKMPPPGPPKVIRLPGQKLPEIPTRSRVGKNCFTFKAKPSERSSDLSWLLEEGMDYIALEDGMRVSQTISIDDEEYVITCAISGQHDNHYLLISAQHVAQPDIQIAPESLLISELCSILDLLKFKDTFPNNMLVKFINNFRKFAQFFLFPFIRVVVISEIGDTEMKKLELWSSPNTIYYQDIEADVLGNSCFIQLYQVSTNTIRMVAIESTEDEEETQADALRIDFVFNPDAESVYLVQYEKGQVEDEAFHQIVNSIKKLDDSFLDFITQSLPCFEAFVQEHLPDSSYQGVVSNQDIILVRVTLEGKALRPTLWVVLDDPKTRTWNIWAIDVGLEKNYTQLCYKYTYEKLIVNFAVKVDKLALDERALICNYALDSMRIDIIGDSCLINCSPIEQVMAHRLVVGKEQRTTLTVSLIGCKDSLIGIKAVIYNPEFCVEKGVLLILEGEFYKNSNQTPLAIKKKKYQAMDKLFLYTTNETHLEKILEDQKGWKTVINHLKVHIAKGDYGITLIDRLQEVTLIDSVENVILHYN